MAFTDYIDPGNSGGSVPIPDTQYPIKIGIVDPVFICEECKKTFNNEKQFDEHKYTVHPIKSPLIIIKGEQIGHTKKRIFEKLTYDDIKIENCTHAIVNQTNKVTPKKLIKLLANHRAREFYKLDLANQEYTRIYEIEFSVADTASLDAIDKAFTTHFREGNLTLQKTNQFANEAMVYQGGQDYASAYLAYLFGVLAKEKNEEILTSFTDYLAKFNEANEVLKYYPRSLARSVCAIISFNNNFFEETQGLAIHLPDILNACVFIQNGLLSDSISSRFSDGKLMPIDWVTEKIITISKIFPNNLEQLAEHEEWLKSGRIPAKDKDKMRVMLARKYKQTGNENKTAELLKSLRNNPDFESIVNNISDKT
jgi:hypothetical protein